MTNEEALRLAKLAWPGFALHVELRNEWCHVSCEVAVGRFERLLDHRNRARFEAALRALAGEPAEVTCSTCGAPWALGQSHTCGVKP